LARVGVGFDAHGFTSDRKLVLGGVDIPESEGLAGHSDADVLSHAVADALMGAANLGDLGSAFPDDDRWRDASSLDILRRTAAAVAAAGYRVGNIDSTVIAQRPRLAPYRDAMRDNIAASVGAEPDAVSVKATTTDGLGFTGRGDGIAAVAVAFVETDADVSPD
jgi:2-C-methyl-D-erythritol 2,4-cyclodiphosphate synthase